MPTVSDVNVEIAPTITTQPIIQLENVSVSYRLLPNA